MSSPQVEDGYTRIANELLEAILRFNFSKRELNIVMAVIRKTYGWNKTKDDISLSQIETLTGIKSSHISCSLRDLADQKVLLIREGKFGQTIGINKKHNEWKLLPKREYYRKSKEGVTKSVKKGLPEQEPQKTLLKDTSKRQEEPNPLKLIEGRFGSAAMPGGGL